MTKPLSELRQSVVELLREWGLQALEAMEPDSGRRWVEPVVAVSLQQVACTAGGFQHYLGVKTDETTGAISELYGKKAELVMALDIYAPRSGGESACQQALALLTDAVMRQGIGGLPVLELKAQSTAFLDKVGMYRLPVSCRCKVWLVTTADEESGAFGNFEVRGRRI